MKRFPISNIKPMGWLLHEMRRDIDGFVGNLDEVVPEIIVHDDIYGSNRLTKEIKAKDVGSLNEGWDWEIQYLWWGAEQIGNWLDGLVRYAFMLDDTKAKEKARLYLDRAFDAQDDDGYIGIYAPDLRFNFCGENGELWAQTTIIRPALAYDEMSKEPVYRDRIIKAVECTMRNYPAWKSEPYKTKEDYSGLTHGLMFTDVMYELFLLTEENKYIDYARFLYEDYNKHNVHDQDIFREHLLDSEWRFRDHGAHVYEHIRAVITSEISQQEDYHRLIDMFFGKIAYCVQPSGGPIGDECISQRCANAEKTGYEYCSITELAHSYEMMLETTGDLKWADKVEHLIFNAGFAARHPLRSQISYLNCDNSYRMMGDGMSTPGVGENARYKYSAAHRDAAVCCVPNAGRLLPYFLNRMYFKTDDGILIAMYAPSTFTTESIVIEQKTAYPFENKIEFVVETIQEKTLYLRIPSWAKSVNVEGVSSSRKQDMLEIRCSGKLKFTITFECGITTKVDLLGNDYFMVDSLVYSYPIEAKEHFGIAYERIYRDCRYEPLENDFEKIRSLCDSVSTAECINLGKDIQNPPVYKFKMMEEGSHKKIEIEMVPIGATVLRRTTFPAGDIRMD